MKAVTCAVFARLFSNGKMERKISILNISALWAVAGYNSSINALCKELRMRQEKDSKGTQVYEKPKLRAIELAAEEVLATGCKTSYGDPRGVANNGCLTGVCSSKTGS